MEQNNEQLSFYELLEKHAIEIPIIQRDYAQGRKEHSEVLDTFLSALKESIESQKKIQLDFIYGDIIDGSFQPLDGQQRLTTLFLLHWYAIKKEKVDENNLLEKFSYETRYSSRNFCKALVGCDIEYNADTESISKLIIDSSWFYLSWQKDPTIQSMLTALDKIHKKFNNTENLWDILKEKKIITFYYVELENIGLTDDLYIRMNARGKLLTPFENFKATLQQKSIEEKWEELQSQKKFFLSIDTQWTNYFWKNFRTEDNRIDDAHIRFISAIIMTQLALDDEEATRPLIQKINENPNEIRTLHVTKESFHYLYRCYEKYSSGRFTDSSNLNFTLWRHSSEKSLICDIVYNNTSKQTSSSYTTKILFYAQTQFLLNNEEINMEKYSDWMRVIRNIVSKGDISKDGERTDIVRSPDSYIKAIMLVKALSNGCSDIYEYLRTSDIPILFSQAQSQVKEEQFKSKIFKDKPEIKQLIWDIEDNELLRGRIEFVLHCIDFEEDKPLNEELLKKVKDVFHMYFNDEKTISNELRRAMLCIDNGDNNCSFYDYWESEWGGIPDTTLNKRRLLNKFRDLEYIIYRDKKDYFKNLVLKLIEKTLGEIIHDFMPPENLPKWQNQLIKEPKWLKDKPSNYIAFPDDKSYCYLLKSPRPRNTDGCTKIE